MNVNVKRLAVRSGALTAIAGTLLMVGCGVSEAATPAGTTSGGGVHAVQSTQGFNVYNYSAETYKFDKVTGSLPAPDTHDFMPGQKRNFEMPVEAFKHTTGEAYYTVYGPDNGPQTGTMTISLNSDDAWDVEFYNMDGSQNTALTVPDNPMGTTMHLEDAPWSTAAQQTFTPGSSDEQTVLQQLCENDSSACTFKATGETITRSAARLLAEGYNGAPSGGGDSTLTADNGYTDTTTDEWGGSVSAEASVLGMVDVQVQATYSHSVEKSTDFSTSWSVPVPPGETGYIWAEIPQFEDTGTFTVHLGNDNWVLPGVTFDNAVPKGVLMYSNTFASGNVPQPLDPGAH
ncbi:hypothetical protein SAMN05892883_1942 [Jatrophihabitans sp. GAS493]|uniref:hypothetical protein n=1 Tax=Jatrophihabitans sp. GAS493 TaxID=1907575 RepID=UPI000BB71238|nr:hypothetical protein [Jatrophihabitans sp. GAS493]SOD72558.1 hypothetical protein SAMN05892883_1942 [Jatrophihabitans sp. GAS493]